MGCESHAKEERLSEKPTNFGLEVCVGALTKSNTFGTRRARAGSWIFA